MEEITKSGIETVAETIDKSDWSWKEIIAQEVADFLFAAPKSFMDIARRVAVLCVATFLGLSGYLVVQVVPGAAQSFLNRPEDALKQEFEEPQHKGAREEAEKWLQRWYDVYKPEMLAMVSWREIPQIDGLWVRPRSYESAWLGPRPLFPEMRQLGGAFSFNECGQTPARIGDYVIIGCPISSKVNNWGMLIAFVPVDRVGSTDAIESLHQLAVSIAGLVY